VAGHGTEQTARKHKNGSTVGHETQPFWDTEGIDVEGRMSYTNGPPDLVITGARHVKNRDHLNQGTTPKTQKAGATGSGSVKTPKTARKGMGSARDSANSTSDISQPASKKARGDAKKAHTNVGSGDDTCGDSSVESDGETESDVVVKSRGSDIRLAKLAVEKALAELVHCAQRTSRPPDKWRKPLGT
jgi:hypothetical protein